MSNNKIRTSGNRIKPVGYRKPDWSRQSLFFNSEKTGKPKQKRRKFLRQQTIVDGLKLIEDATINEIEMVEITESINGKDIRKQVAIGRYKGLRVQRVGYAYSNSANGRTPGMWKIVG